MINSNSFSITNDRPRQKNGYNSFVRTNFRLFKAHYKIDTIPETLHELGKAWKTLNDDEKELYQREEYPKSRLHPERLNSYVRKSVVSNARRTLTTAKRPYRRRTILTPSVAVRRSQRRIYSNKSDGNVRRQQRQRRQSSDKQRTDIFTSEFLQLSKEREQAQRNIKQTITDTERRIDILQALLTSPQSDNLIESLKNDIASLNSSCCEIKKWQMDCEQRLKDSLQKIKMNKQSIEHMGLLQLIEYLAEHKHIPKIKKIVHDVFCA
ncbi:hypothetical protein GJ496_004734 [Pomphorhynchus laevis]|nr:hypothetical protein GJ496_004734 [Pomphorhynchus laevis]